MSARRKKSTTETLGGRTATGDAFAGLLEAARSKRTDLVLADAGRVSGLAEGEFLVFVADRRGVAATAVQLPNGTRVDIARGAAIAKLAVEQLGAGKFDSQKEAVLTKTEGDFLRAGGFDNSELEGESPADAGQLEFVKLLEGSLSALQAAKLLHVNPSRIRQRSSARELLAIKDGPSWKLPRFQFLKDRLVPGIDRVFSSLPVGMNPVAIQRWLNTHHPDLELEDRDQPATPLEWLMEGNDPARVSELAALLP